MTGKVSLNIFLKGFQHLAGAGCEFAALTGITPHVVLDEIRKRAPIPVISMIDTTAQALLKPKKFHLSFYWERNRRCQARS